MKSELPAQEQNVQIEHYLRDFALAVEEISEVVILLDKTGTITWVNNSFVKVHGHQPEEVAGKSFADFLENNQASKIKVDEIVSAIKKGKEYTGTVFLIHTTKRLPLWNEIKIKPVKEGHGKVSRYVVIARDITEHIKSNEELLYSEMRWKFALEESGDGFFDYDMANNRFYGSDNLKELIAVSGDSTHLDFRALINIIHPADSEQAVNALFDLISGKTETLRQGLARYNLIKTILLVMVNVTGNAVALYFFRSLPGVAFVSILAAITGIVSGLYFILLTYADWEQVFLPLRMAKSNKTIIQLNK